MKKLVLCVLLTVLTFFNLSAQDSTRFVIGGYGEAVYSHNFYSNSPYRYMYADRYKDSQGHSQVDLPHVVVMMGYDFGKGWSMGSEIEFEHGGVEASIEVEGDEAIEVEHEIERGGEVYLEQFWLQKTFNPAINVRAGMVIVPVGLTNYRHEPDKFFTVYRQEGESTIIPCTWHQIGVSVFGRLGDWGYTAQVLPGLNSRFFSNDGWVSGGSASPYEYTMANDLAFAFRVDNYSFRNLRLGLSGYVGGTDNDAYPRTVSSSGSTSTGVAGTVLIGSFDFEYKGSKVIARGNADYGYLDNAAAIGTSNKNSDNSTFSPYSHTLVGENAMAFGAEAGYDVFTFLHSRKLEGQKLFAFVRGEYYDSYVAPSGQTDYEWSDKTRMAVGINYSPISNIILKAEYSHRFFKSQYNNEPSINIGITYTGFFRR
ncbi:MAG: hypothetical protein K5984_07305 [Bacteroidales bacterium]|nr:hypothetical protein [Bacteroidales bacterium]